MSQETTPSAEQFPEHLLTQKTVETVVRNFLKERQAEGAHFPGLGESQVMAHGDPKLFPKGNTVTVQFMLDTPLRKGEEQRFEGIPVEGGYGVEIMRDLSGYDTTGSANMTFVLRFTADEYRRLAEGETADSRGEVKNALSGSEHVNLPRLEAAKALHGKIVDNNGGSSGLVPIAGTIKATVTEGGDVVLQFNVNGLDGIKHQGDVIVDGFGRAYFPTGAECDRYLRQQSGEDANVLADYFIEQLQAEA